MVCGTNLFRMGETEAHAGLPHPERTASPRKPKKSTRGAAPVKRHGKLVIVESPAKAKTVGRFLGRGYTVRASVGHIRDLLRSTLSVDVDHDFAPKYRVPNEKREVVKALKAEAAQAADIYLATDPDREGEAIAWHLLEAAEIEPERARRVVFHEITKPAIEEAFAHPREIAMDLVNAQQARRILDRLVGYSLSPLLWAKVRGRLSAGRVQSVAVRLIVDREREIDAFVPAEYWSIEAELKKAAPNGKHPPETFRARLVKIGDEDVGTGEASLLKTDADVQAILAELNAAQYSVARVKIGERKRSPSAPFTTSTLQQEALAPAGLHGQAHHGHRAAALRRHGDRRRPGHRPDHLYAHRQHECVDAGANRGARVCDRALRRGLSARPSRRNIRRAPRAPRRRTRPSARPRWRASPRPLPSFSAATSSSSTPWSGSGLSPARWRRPCSTRFRLKLRPRARPGHISSGCPARP